LLKFALEQGEALQPLAHLPGALLWLQLVTTAFDGRLWRADTRTCLTAGDALRQAPAGERGRWERAFTEFCAAWKLRWAAVEQFECQAIPQSYRAVAMGRDTPLAFCLPGDSDEGICPQALVRSLVETHNEFVRLARDGANDEEHLVSSRHVTAAHAVVIDVDNDLAPFLRLRCVAADGHHCDFTPAEARLRRIAAALPEIACELRLCGFREERSAGDRMGDLRRKIPQQPLPRAVHDAVAADL
ncbi:unnamed protein product, partial [Phaeothamnion confervicola]